MTAVAVARVNVVVVVVVVVVVWERAVSRVREVDVTVVVLVEVEVVAGGVTPRREQSEETLDGLRRWRRGVESSGQAVRAARLAGPAGVGGGT
jgi:hypothetical protein